MARHVFSVALAAAVSLSVSSTSAHAEDGTLAEPAVSPRAQRTIAEDEPRASLNWNVTYSETKPSQSALPPPLPSESVLFIGDDDLSSFLNAQAGSPNFIFGE